jgi:hypothetical protein
MKGKGTHIKPRKAGTDDAQLPGEENISALHLVTWSGIRITYCMPRFEYICEVKRGNAAPKSDRNTEFAARTDAAKIV